MARPEVLHAENHPDSFHLEDFQIDPQPNDTTCGPTCLQAVYRYFGDQIPLERVVRETSTLRSGGTLSSFLANHALARGYSATIYSYNLQLFDPTWFKLGKAQVIEKLKAQASMKKDGKLHEATEAYIQFLELGGILRMEDLRPRLMSNYLRKGLPVLTGLSSTYLYQTMREYGPNDDDDDIRGEPQGHFVVLSGYDMGKREVRVADPMRSNPTFPHHMYTVSIERAITAILLGIVTYDANLLIIEPKRT